MPIYEYTCRACGEETEKLQKLSEPDWVDCPSCEKPELYRTVSAAGFRLSGSGWYETDFKKDGKRNLSGDDGNSGSSSSSGSSSGSGSTSGTKSDSSSDSGKSSEKSSSSADSSSKKSSSGESQSTSKAAPKPKPNKKSESTSTK